MDYHYPSWFITPQYSRPSHVIGKGDNGINPMGTSSRKEEPFLKQTMVGGAQVYIVQHMENYSGFI